MLFQGEKDMREMLGEGPFYKELGIYEYNREFKENIANNYCIQEYMFIIRNIGKSFAKITAYGNTSIKRENMGI